MKKVKVTLVGLPDRIFENAEYLVCQNGTLAIYPPDVIFREGHIPFCLATFNHDVWKIVECDEPESDLTWPFTTASQP
jgi:hypothetical protein